MYRSGKDFVYCPVQEKQDSKFMLNEAPLPTLEFSGSINVRTFFIQGNQKALRRGELFDCLDQNILRIPVNP